MQIPSQPPPFLLAGDAARARDHLRGTVAAVRHIVDGLVADYAPAARLDGGPLPTLPAAVEAAMLNDFGAFIGWLGVCLAAGALAWLSLREKATSVWIGMLSLIPVLATVLLAMIVAIAGFPGIVGPIWLIVAFAALALTRNGTP